MNARRAARRATPSSSAEVLLKHHAATYDALAPAYHAARFGNQSGRYDFAETTALVQEIVARRLGRTRDWCGLDVACGTGKVAVAAVQVGGLLTALDAAPAMLEQCSARAREAGVQEYLAVVNASADHLPYADDVFDVVFSFRFLHLFPLSTYVDLIREMVRVTRPGGYIVLEMKNRRYGVALYPLLDMIRTMKGDRELSSYMGIGALPALAKQIGGIELESSHGLLIPKGWWLTEHRRLSQHARALARGPLKGVSAHVVSVYRKM